MKLSIVIVNYNVKFFLEQCLQSVYTALKGIEAEVFVVDNNSVDGSCLMVKQKFSNVYLLENKENTGFSKANNQAIRISKGEYVLLLNPDTLVEEDTFSKCISYLDNNNNVGGLGVKMIDGKGNFLPESKRGLPTPWVSFCKIFGLSFLFPKSKLFGRYHLGYLAKEEINEIDILPGAFMMIRKKVLDDIGLLDETFFMYGEDIDLSYRITKSGFKNIYFPETTIIHYKGESTKKGSINYVMVFYNAMIIFARKHFSKRYASFFSFFINLAIYFRAILAIIKRVLFHLVYPVVDATIIFLGYVFIGPYWENYKFGAKGVYPDLFLKIIVPSYILIWLFSIYASGGYTRPFRILKIRRGIFLGSFVILLIYALLPEYLRFSRALIIIGMIYTLLVSHIVRLLVNLLQIKTFKTEFRKLKKRIVIVGEMEEANRVYSILKYSHIVPDLEGVVSPDSLNGAGYIGNISQLSDIIRINNIEEIIFCGKNISSQEIIKNMLHFSDENVDFKIAPPESVSIIGSNSINTSGDLYTVTFNSVSKPSNRRKKRFLDIAFSSTLLLFSPVLLMLYRSQKKFIANIYKILKGTLTFVGYTLESPEKKELLRINGIFYPEDQQSLPDNSPEAIFRLNNEYAQNYSVQVDISIILKNFFSLDKAV